VDFPAAVCVVLHIAPDSRSALPLILDRASRLPCHAAQDGDPLLPGSILVAPPDRHLVVEDGHVRLTSGPRENGHRPAVDPLFRSAAAAGRRRVIGVILSGTRDDGAAGLAAIKASGGAALVQDPKEALYAGMPTSALAHVTADAVARSEALASTLTAMVNGNDLPPEADPPPSSNEQPSQRDEVTVVCPECGGVLRQRAEGQVTQWECRVGHRYSPDSLLESQARQVESALWAAVRALEDREALLARLAEQAESRGQSRSARGFRIRATAAGDNARIVRQALGHTAETTLRMVEDPGEGEEVA